MKVIFTMLNIQIIPLLLLLRSVRIVNKASEVKISNPGEGFSLLPLCWLLSLVLEVIKDNSSVRIFSNEQRALCILIKNVAQLIFSRALIKLEDPVLISDALIEVDVQEKEFPVAEQRRTVAAAIIWHLVPTNCSSRCNSVNESIGYGGVESDSPRTRRNRVRYRGESIREVIDFASSAKWYTLKICTNRESSCFRNGIDRKSISMRSRWICSSNRRNLIEISSHSLPPSHGIHNSINRRVRGKIRCTLEISFFFFRHCCLHPVVNNSKMLVGAKNSRGNRLTEHT